MVGSSIFLFDDEWSDVVTGFLVMFGVCTVAERKLQGDNDQGLSHYSYLVQHLDAEYWKEIVVI